MNKKSLIILVFMFLSVNFAWANIKTYDFTDVTPAGPHDAYYCDVDCFPFNGYSSNRNSLVEASDEQYSDISVSDDDAKWETSDPGDKDVVFMWFEMNNITEYPLSVDRIDLTFEGHCTKDSDFYIYVMKAGENWTQNDSWVQVGNKEEVEEDKDETITREITSSCGDYIDGTGKLVWGVYSSNGSELIRIDYVKIEITEGVRIIYAETVDDNMNGKIDAYHIVFSTDIDDNFNVNGFNVDGYTGVAFVSTGLPNHPDIADDNQIFISFTEGNFADTDKTPDITYDKATGGLERISGILLPDVNTTDLIETDGAAPVILTAIASDPPPLSDGINKDDEILFEFSEPVYGPPLINYSNIDEVLSSSATIEFGDNIINPCEWKYWNSALKVTFINSAPTIEPDYTITTDTFTFKDSAGNVSSQTVILEGDFGSDSTPPVIISRETQDLDSDGYLDNIHIIFSENIDDNTVNISSFIVSGVSGVSFSSTTNGDFAGDEDIYITFSGTLKTNEKPDLTCIAGAIQDFGENPVAYSNQPCADKAPPIVLSAVASDEEILIPGVDEDDTVTISFSEITLKPTIDESNIDFLLCLSGPHTWKDAYGAWNILGDVLTISFGTQASSATVIAGDTITVSGAHPIKIKDASDNTCVDSRIIDGSFTGNDSTHPVVSSFYPENEATGIGINSKIQINFNERMDADNTKTAVSVKEIKNNLAEKIDNLVSGGITCDASNSEFIFTPLSPLKNNFTYQVIISTHCTDTIGNPLEKKIFRFTTICSCKGNNIFLCSDEKTSVKIEPDTLTKDYSIKVNTAPFTQPESKITQANGKLAGSPDKFTFPFNYTLREINVYDIENNEIKKGFKNKAHIQIPYKDEDNDGFVDDTLPQVSEKSLSIYYLEENHDIWVKIPSNVDPVNNTVSAEVAHFSVFMLSGSNYTDLSKAYAFPVPFMPGDGHDKITWTNLSSKATINIYTVSGRLVKTLNETDGDFIHEWFPVENDKGKEVVSGVYIYRIYNEEKSKTGKLVIIR